MEDSILLVDDNPDVLAELQRQLTESFEVVAARSGDEACAAVGRANLWREPFAVVVCDMVMPGMDGIEVLKRIKVLSPGTVRIMLTGKADQRTAVDAINEGNVFRFFVKPCPMRELVAGLRAAVLQHRSGAADPGPPEETGLPSKNGVQAPVVWNSGNPAGEEHGARRAATLVARRNPLDMPHCDIVNHDRLLAVAEDVWHSVPWNRRAGYSVRDWQAAIHDKCRIALLKAEKKLAENNPEPALLKANINILHSTFGRQVIRAMQEISERYRHALAARQAKAPYR